METFVEKDCTITHEGKEFTADGSYLLPCKDGKIRGVAHVKPSGRHNGSGRYHGQVTTWHGDFISDCLITYYYGNFCRMARVSFELDGKKFVGDYCPDWADACKVRSTK